MPLNNSGPLSFGGSTVGQSINLELGLSATATASINSTAFRTLAGVPSGQISVSNFYGKSNSFGWIAWLGSGNTGGSPTQSSESAFVDRLGNVYWRFRGGSDAQGQYEQNAIAVMNKDATRLTFTSIYIGSGFVPAVLWNHCTLFPSAGRFLVSASFSDQLNFPFYLLNSSLGRISPRQGLGGTVVSCVAVTPNGNVFTTTRRSEDDPIIRRLNASTGAVEEGWSTFSGGFFYSDETRIAPQSNNSAVWLAKSASIISWSRIPSTGTSVAGYSATFTDDGGQGSGQGSAVDSSDNVFFVNNIGWLFKVSTANTLTGRTNTTPTGSAAMVAAHGSVVYTVKGSSDSLQIRAFNSGTLDPLWLNTVTLGTSPNIQYVAANAEGLYLHISGTGGVYHIKIPLTGFPANGSTAVSGPSGITLSWTVGTFSAASISPGSTGSGRSITAGFGTITPPEINGGSAATPTNVKTDLA